jgi:Pentapeptide repeats (8 copies)
MANAEQVALLKRGIDEWNAWRQVHPYELIDLSSADLRGEYLSVAKLNGANLKGADLSGARLNETDLSQADLSRACLAGAHMRAADVRGAILVGANVSRGSLAGARLGGANLTGVNLSWADLRGTNLLRTYLSGADLTKASLRSANLQHAVMDGATLTDAQLWETQRAGWSIKGVTCARAFWDKDGTESTNYAPGEFERLYSEQACIELFYQGGVSKFELNTLPALLHHLASLHQDANIRLKSIEETGGGAKISISVGDSDPETVEKIRSDALQVYQAQLALRDNEILRLDTEKKYLESFVSERLIKAMLTATTPQNVFNAPVYGAAFPSGNAKVELHQTINDNTAILALLEKIMRRHQELKLSQRDASLLQAEVQSAKAELVQAQPSPSILSRSLSFVQKIATEAVTKAAGKLGEQAASVDWHSVLHQLNDLVQHLK